MAREREPFQNAAAIQDVLDSISERDDKIVTKCSPELGGIDTDGHTVDSAGDRRQTWMSRWSTHRYDLEPLGSNRRARAAATAAARRFASAVTTRMPKSVMR